MSARAQARSLRASSSCCVGRAGPASRHSTRSPPPDQLESTMAAVCFPWHRRLGYGQPLPSRLRFHRDRYLWQPQQHGPRQHRVDGPTGAVKGLPFVELARTPGRANDDIVASPPPPPTPAYRSRAASAQRRDLGAYSATPLGAAPGHVRRPLRRCRSHRAARTPPRVLLVTNDPTKLWQYSLPLGGRPPVLMYRHAGRMGGYGGLHPQPESRWRRDGRHYRGAPPSTSARISLPPLPSSASSSVSISVPLSGGAGCGISTACRRHPRNKGAEGVAYDPQANCLYVIIESKATARTARRNGEWCRERRIRRAGSARSACERSGGHLLCAAHAHPPNSLAGE